MGLGGRRGQRLTWRSHVSNNDTLSGGDPWSVFFFTFIFYILANEMTYSFVANRIPESLIIALLIRILH